MELDDLKQSWQHAGNMQKQQNENIMQLIQNKSYGPVAVLKREFKKQMRLMLILPVLILITLTDDVNAIATNILFWCYVAFCIGVCLFAYFNYQLVSKMEGFDVMVKSNLEQQLSTLETRLKWHVISARIALVFFILLAEVLPYFKHYRMLDKWHALSPWIRFFAYIALLVLQYFVSRAVCHKRFGQHLAYLKNLVHEMQ